MSYNILVLDDEKEIADLVELSLNNPDYNIYKFADSKKAIECIKNTKLDMAILDVMLPDIDGFTICQMIREKYNFPILMLTAKVDDVSKIKGLSIGADDYITKPFNILELKARVRALLRRAGMAAQQMGGGRKLVIGQDRKSTRLNSSHQL